MMLKANRFPVSITACAMASALGEEPERFFQRLCDGEQAISPKLTFGNCPVACVDPIRLTSVSKLEHSGDRTEELLRYAANRMINHPHFSRVDPTRLGICVGTTQGMIESWEREQRILWEHPDKQVRTRRLYDVSLFLARLLGARGPVSTPSVACASG